MHAHQKFVHRAVHLACLHTPYCRHSRIAAAPPDVLNEIVAAL